MKPFEAETYTTPRGQLVTFELCADGRLRWVARCDDSALLEQCLRVRALQKTVRVAIERRLRSLERQA